MWKKKKKKKRKMKYARSNWCTKYEEQISNFVVSERKEEDAEEKGRKRDRSPRAREALVNVGKMARQNWLCIDAAAWRLEPKGETEVPNIIVVSEAPK